MSATFRHAKQKPTQQELRRLMSAQKSSATAARASGSGAAKSTRIDSPLAKYNDLGQLQCVLCKTIVRSAEVWPVHINAKQHRENIEQAKQLRQQMADKQSASGALKRPAEPPKRSASAAAAVPEKRLKGILKNSASEPAAQSGAAAKPVAASAIPSDFFDSPKAAEASGPTEARSISYYEATMQKTTIRQDLLSIKREPKASASAAGHETAAMEVDAAGVGAAAAAAVDEALPEGFFDDPVKDAKARNLEYKDPVEEEWDRFQKEIKAAADTSNAIMAEDQVEATTERQIGEIDEQMRNWSRVLSLEKRKELVREQMAKRKAALAAAQSSATDEAMDTDSDDSEDGDEEAASLDAADGTKKADEFLDWRAKRSQLKKSTKK